MPEEDEFDLPRVAFRKRWAPLQFSDANQITHRFGGPLAFHFDNYPSGYPLPHRVLTLQLEEPAFRARQSALSRIAVLLSRATLDITAIPLIYPYRLDGAAIKYRVLDDHRGIVQELFGEPSRDWPYKDYPDELPLKPLMLGDFSPVHWECDDDSDDCDEQHPWQTEQDSRPEGGEFLVIVPPNDAYGVSLWGREGDRQGVQTIFRVNLRRATVEGWNECS